MTVAKAIVDCQGIVMADRLIDTTEQAQSNDLLPIHGLQVEVAPT